MAGKRQVDRRAQIIEGALKVFSAKGFKAATNKDVAEACGIASAGLIYHYFTDKAALLRAVIEHNVSHFELFAHADELMSLPIEQALFRFARGYAQLLNDDRIGATMRLLFVEAVGDSRFAGVLAEAGPLRVWKMLASYLEAQMHQGTIRVTHAGLAARSFVGPLVIHMLERRIFGKGDTLHVDIDTLATHCVQVFMRGMRP